MRYVVCLIVPLLLGACSTIIEGSSQEIAINSVPPGAACGLYREGVRIGTVTTTPGTALVKKSKHHIAVLCVKPGYQQANLANRSDVAAASFGNIILGGLIGVIIDSSTGADNKYEGNVTVTLAPDAPDRPPGPMSLPEQFAATVGGQPPAAAPAEAPGTAVPAAEPGQAPERRP